MKPRPSKVPALGEPDGHAMMRNATKVLRILLIVALVATVVLFLVQRSAAYLAAFPIPVLFLAFVFVSYLERQSRALEIRSRNQTVISQQEVEMNVQFAGIYTALILTLLLALGAFIVAATMFDGWSMTGMVAAFLFLLSVFILFPYIPLFIAEAAHDERDKLQRDAAHRKET